MGAAVVRDSPLPCIQFLNELANIDVAFDEDWMWINDSIKELDGEEIEGSALLGGFLAPIDQIMLAIMQNAPIYSNVCFLLSEAHYYQHYRYDPDPNLFVHISIMHGRVAFSVIPDSYFDQNVCSILAFAVGFDGFQSEEDAHMAFVLINNLNKTMMWYDSNGFIRFTRKAGFYHTDWLEKLLQGWKKAQPGLEQYKFISMGEWCPYGGVQDDTGGSCAAWSLLIILLQFLCPQSQLQTIVQAIHSTPSETRQKIIHNWIKYCVQIYHFHVKKARKPIRWYRQHSTLPFNPLLGERLRKPKASKGRIQKPTASRAKKNKSRVVYLPERMTTRGIMKHRKRSQ
jgi:hypothetical protein